MDSTQDSEISDAKHLLAANGHSPKDFEFQMSRREYPGDGNLYLIRYTVSVTGRGRTREYLGGHGLNWLKRFEFDLIGW